jgi:hypothetical protein
MLAAGLVSAVPASAAPLDAADFAADCNDDGEVDVSGTQRYIGGSGTISGPCLVNLTSDANFVLREVNLTGTSLVAGLRTVENTTIKVIDSVITLSDPSPFGLGGVLELSTGGESDEPGANGRIVIRGSKINAGGIYVQTSFDWPDGTIIIKDSTLATSVGDITVRASDLNGTNGKVRISRTDLISATDITVGTGLPAFGSGAGGLTKVISSFLQAPSGSIDVLSGPSGVTKVRNTALSSPAVTLTTGAGGVCRSTGNTPAVLCS